MLEIPDVGSVLSIVFVGSVSFLVGLIVGSVAGQHGITVEKQTFRYVLAGIIVLVWVVSILAEIAIASYTTHVFVHGIMGAVAGYLFSEDGINVSIGRR